MQKIFVTKSETLKEILQKIREAVEEIVVLVIPRDSEIRDSLEDFKTLKKEAKALSKQLVIESVDDKVLSKAKTARIEAIHPLLSEPRAKRSLSDIVVISAEKKEKEKEKELKIQKEKKAAPKRIALKKKGGEKIEKPTPLIVPEEKVSKPEKNLPIPKVHKPFRIPFPKLNFRKSFVLIPLVVLIIIGVFAANIFLSKAEVTLKFQKTPWEHSHIFLASKAISKDGASGYSVPGQLLIQQKNLTQFFQASGKADVSEKARGQIRIFNAYGTNSQTLVKNTRFETPDGKIFRLDLDVIVPGAKLEKGVISPSSIKANITADKAGPEYNLEKVDKLTIPGFAGTARYTKFYGAIEEPTHGGFIGAKAIATDADIENAEKKSFEAIKGTFESVFLTRPPEGLFIIPGASEFRVVKYTSDRVTNGEGKFAVFTEAEFRALAIREDDVRKLLGEKALSENPDMKVESMDIVYSDLKPDFEKGELSFNVSAKATLAPSFNPEEFKPVLFGLSKAEAKAKLLNIPKINSGSVKLSPFWRWNIPKSASKVNIIVE